MDTIKLDNPKNITVSQFLECYQTGSDILNRTKNLSPTLLLRGFTELSYDNLVDALSNLWIVVEQLTDLLWQKQFLADSNNHPIDQIPKRKSTFLQDNRTWSTSVKQEMLFQKAIIPAKTYAKIYPARKARNDLVHEGQRPSMDIVKKLFDGVLDLIGVAATVDPAALRNLHVRNNEFVRRQKDYSLDDWKITASQHDAGVVCKVDEVI